MKNNYTSKLSRTLQFSGGEACSYSCLLLLLTFVVTSQIKSWDGQRGVSTCFSLLWGTAGFMIRMQPRAPELQNDNDLVWASLITLGRKGTQPLTLDNGFRTNYTLTMSTSQNAGIKKWGVYISIVMEAHKHWNSVMMMKSCSYIILH